MFHALLLAMLSFNPQQAYHLGITACRTQQAAQQLEDSMKLNKDTSDMVLAYLQKQGLCANIKVLVQPLSQVSEFHAYNGYWYLLKGNALMCQQVDDTHVSCQTVGTIYFFAPYPIQGTVI